MSFPRYPKYKDSGVEWLGQVPEGWDLAPLKYAASFTSGGTPSKARPDYWDGDVPWASSKDLKCDALSDTSDHITQLAVADGAHQTQAGDLMVVVRGMILAHTFPVTKALVPMAINQDLKGVRPRGGWTVDYLAHLLRAATPETFRRLDEAGHGTKALRMETWLGMLTPKPPLPEQTAIAAFLDRETAKIDALIGEQERLIALLKEKRQAVISHAVTKGLNPKAPMKDSGVEWLGEIPAHWEVSRMGTIANIVRGASPRPAGDPRYFDGDAIAWLTVAEVTKDDEIYVTGTEACLTLEGAAQSNRFARGTLVYSNSGATLGVPKILKIDACANDGVIAFLSLRVNVLPEFLYYYLASITDEIREKVRQGSGQPNLNTDIVKNLRFGVPPMIEQESIATWISSLAREFRRLTAEAQSAIDLLQERRTALISAAVTGQIDVRNAAGRAA